mmetsp:Transcript_116411/g.324394  ORF Transcript_116411/g.324394 Transcript_116411/m.324394 type:complete len:244 (+) Transcript_116411:190-921(+)
MSRSSKARSSHCSESWKLSASSWGQHMPKGKSCRRSWSSWTTRSLRWSRERRAPLARSMAPPLTQRGSELGSFPWQQAWPEPTWARTLHWSAAPLRSTGLREAYWISSRKCLPALRAMPRPPPQARQTSSRSVLTARQWWQAHTPAPFRSRGRLRQCHMWSLRAAWLVPSGDHPHGSTRCSSSSCGQAQELHPDNRCMDMAWQPPLQAHCRAQPRVLAAACQALRWLHWVAALVGRSAKTGKS